MCRLLDLSSQISDDDLFEAIDVASQNLKEFEILKSKGTEKLGPPRFQIIHSVHCHAVGDKPQLYLEQPWAVEDGPLLHLRGSKAINNFDLFLERNKEIAFIIYKDYECCDGAPSTISKSKIEVGLEVDASTFLTGEHIQLISNDLRLALETLASKVFDGIPHPFSEEEDYPSIGSRDKRMPSQFLGEKDNRSIEYPYMFLFHRRKEVEEVATNQPPGAQIYLDVFFNYLFSRMAEEWAVVDQLLAQKKISAKYLDYLFVSNLTSNMHYRPIASNTHLSGSQPNSFDATKRHGCSTDQSICSSRLAPKAISRRFRTNGPSVLVGIRRELL